MSNLAEVPVDILLLLSRDLRVVDLLTVNLGHLNPDGGVKQVPVNLRELLRDLGVSWDLQSQVVGFPVDLKDSIPRLVLPLPIRTKNILAISSFDRSRLPIGHIEDRLLIHGMAKDLSLLRLLKSTLHLHSRRTSLTDFRLDLDVREGMQEPESLSLVDCSTVLTPHFI